MLIVGHGGCGKVQQRVVTGIGVLFHGLHISGLSLRLPSVASTCARFASIGLGASVLFAGCGQTAPGALVPPGQSSALALKQTAIPSVRAPNSVYRRASKLRPSTTPIADEALQVGQGYPKRETWNIDPNNPVDPTCDKLDWSYTNTIPGVTVTLNPATTSLTGGTTASFSTIPSSTAVGVYTETVTPTCTNPNASGILPSPITYTIAVVSFDIARVAQVRSGTPSIVSNKSFNSVIGEFTELEDLANPDVALNSLLWAIGGDTVKSYSESPSGASFSSLTSADLARQVVDFYWLEPGSEQSSVVGVFPVFNSHCESDKCTGAEAYWGTATADTTAVVSAPTNIALTSSTGKVDVLQDPLFDCADSLAFGLINSGSACDSNNAVAGISWQFTATAPTGGTGQIDGTQVIDRSESATGGFHNTPAAPVGAQTNGYELDTCVRFGTASRNNTQILEGKTATWSGQDAPGQALSDTWKSFQISDQARMYFVYQRNNDAGAPASRSNIWVSLGELDWNWSADASNAGTVKVPKWTVTSEKHMRNPSGSAAFSLPTWSATISLQAPCAP